MIECLLLILLKTRSHSLGVQSWNDAVSLYAMGTKFRAVVFNEELYAILFDSMPLWWL